MKGRVLVCDDEKNLTLVVEAMLEKEGYEALVFNDPRQALKAIEDEKFDLIITDLMMPGVSGMQVLEHAQKHSPETPVVLITAFGTVDAAVAALKAGAYDFITKPFEQTELLNVVKKAVRTQMPLGVSTMVGNSAPLQEVFKIIGKIAGSPSTVLIQGESGTGKELVAFEIHKHSPRQKKPFVKINCAAIPATLIESELFGYERGAFTGAVTSKPGRFELAHEGTLFMDEVAEMPLEMQVKLLRVLQEHEIERVGGISTTRVDVRIIAATNKNLEEEVKAGRFREDLFYRLNVVPIRLPALRERSEDIELLIRHFLAQFNQKLGKSVSRVDPRCLEALKAYGWPGNIRQLENMLERMVLMTEGTTLTVGDLPSEVGFVQDAAATDETGEGASFKEIVRRQTQAVERDLIEKALEETAGNVTRTAEKLGLSRKGLQLKMKELGIQKR